MTKKCDTPYCRHPARAVVKIILLLAALCALGFGAVTLFDDSAFDQIKFDLTLGFLIVLVVAVNVVSLLCFIALYMAYQWVRGDLKAPRSEDSGSDIAEDD